MSDEIRVSTDENEITLRQMSEALPDTSTIMNRVGDSWWHLIYAARGGNWGLAEYYLKRTSKLENTLKVLRPKHRERLERFQATALPAVVAAVEAQNLEALERAYAAATDMANEMHDESGYPYIKWEVPDEAPRGLRLAPVADKSRDTAPGNGRVATPPS
jgi:hypothetical protein